MDIPGNSIYLCLFLLFIASFCRGQINVPITQPTLVAVTPLNSTALNVTWRFANATYDQSDLIRVYIDFYEFWNGYGPVNTSVTYVFTPTNKTITSVIRNFELVSAFYYVCFSSNSTRTNGTLPLYIRKCLLTQTCSRANSSVCPQTGFITVSQTATSSNSFTITVYWLKNLPYVRNSTTASLAVNGMTGTALATSENATYINFPYQFSGLQTRTSYTVSIIAVYTLFGESITNQTDYIATTSRSSNFIYTGDLWIVITWSILFSFLFF